MRLRHCLPFLAAPLLAGAATRQGGPPAKPNKNAQGSAPSPFELPPAEKDAPFVARINDAIRRGEKWLLASQGREGSWQREESGTRVGYTELVLYALASSAERLESPQGSASPPKPAPGAKPKNPPKETGAEVDAALGRGFAFVKAHPHPETYALSLLLLAIDAANAPRWERERLARLAPTERLRYRYPRRLGADDRLWVERTAEEILAHRFKGLWSYAKNPGLGDISNTQFAILGLRAAQNCGHEVDASVWTRSLDYFLEYQDKDGPPARFAVPRGAPEPGRPVEIVTIEGRQRCWGYSFNPGGRPPDPKNPKDPKPRPRDVPVAGFALGGSGTHACIGIASLQILRDELARSLDRRPDPALADSLRAKTPAIDRGIRDGIAWLAARWNLEEDPGGGFPFYYLYSVERVGALLGERFVAGHDWYREGAEILLRRQLEGGAWPSDVGEVNAIGAPDVVSTSFALLFLRRATMPGVFTPDLGLGR